MNSEDSKTVKLLETPKATNYDLHGSKDMEKERVTAFLSLPFSACIPLGKRVVTITTDESYGRAHSFRKGLQERDTVIIFVDELGPKNPGEMGNQQPSSPVAQTEVVFVD